MIEVKPINLDGHEAQKDQHEDVYPKGDWRVFQHQFTSILRQLAREGAASYSTDFEFYFQFRATKRVKKTGLFGDVQHVPRHLIVL